MTCQSPGLANFSFNVDGGSPVTCQSQRLANFTVNSKNIIKNVDAVDSVIDSAYSDMSYSNAFDFTNSTRPTYNIKRCHSRKELSFYYQNMGGMRTSLESFRNDLASTTYDVVFVSETWLNPDILDQEIVPNGWRLFRHD